MKKGFTLIELAIVLVVIGLLLGMAFKGKSLVDAARIKADINKVEKIGTGISVFYAKYDRIPGITGDVTTPDGAKTFTAASSGAIYQALINEGILKDSDFAASTGGTFWQFIGCNHAQTSWTAAVISENNNLCIYRSSKNPNTATGAATTNTDGPSISGATICQMETMLDDSSLTTGDGRLGTTAGTTPTIDTNWNCGDTLQTTVGNVDTNYLFRVF